MNDERITVVVIDESGTKLSSRCNMPTKIRFSNNETGWADELPNNRYVIGNIPLAGDLNIDDVVLCDMGSDGFPHVVDLVERKYQLKSVVQYETVEQFHELFEKVKNAGGKAEGMIGPRNEKPGICMVAHNSDLDIKKFIEEIGIKSEQLEGQPSEVE